MSEQIVIGLFTLAGVFLGGFFTVWAAKIGYNKVQMEKEIKLLANQVKSYWILEKKYLEQISKLSGKSKDTIMRETRKIVAKDGYEYPKMTANDADLIRKKYE